MSAPSPILPYGTLPLGGVTLTIDRRTPDGPTVIGAPASPVQTWTRLTLAGVGAAAITALVIAATYHNRTDRYPPLAVITLLVAWLLAAAYAAVLLLNRDLPTVAAVRDGALVLVYPRLGRHLTRILPPDRLWTLRCVTLGTSFTLKTIGELRVYPAWRLPVTLFRGHEVRLIREAETALKLALATKAAGFDVVPLPPPPPPEPVTPSPAARSA